MTSLLEKDDDYTEIPGDKSTGYERRKNDLVKELIAGGRLIDEERKSITTTYNTKSPAIYGLPKTHKEDYPLRPVMSCSQSPIYNLSRFLSDILKLSISDLYEYNIKDSHSFVERIKNIVVPPDYIMVSFDVKSLFTNVPTTMVRDRVRSLWDKISKHTKINANVFFRMLDLALETRDFAYGGKFYRQNNGLPMGAPLSPVAADVVMDFALNEITKKLDYSLHCLCKYVDDIFCLIPRDRVEETLEASFHPSLQFTVEIEVDAGLPYLDTFVRRNQTTLETVWYKKPTSSHRLLNFNSKHPLQQKIAVAVGFIKRVDRLTTTDRENMRSTIFTHLRINDFPPVLIHRLYDKLLQHKHAINTREVVEVNKTQIRYASISFVPSMSDRIKSAAVSFFPVPQNCNETYKSDITIFYKTKR
ncbi:uncharacterized protein DMENIID0001_152670 [Sergentomyia squamirostris]